MIVFVLCNESLLNKYMRKFYIIIRETGQRLHNKNNYRLKKKLINTILSRYYGDIK